MKIERRVEVEQRRTWTFGWQRSLALVGALAVGAFLVIGSCDGDNKTGALTPSGKGGAGTVGPGSGGSGAFAGDDLIASAAQSLANGRNTFRFDTFGDEAFWGDALKLHLAIEGPAHGGVAPGVSPRTALALGLKVDVDALPPSIVQALQSGAVNLDDPAATLTLLRLNAVVGLTG